VDLHLEGTLEPMSGKGYIPKGVREDIPSRFQIAR
jgi:hypothetical protein